MSARSTSPRAASSLASANRSNGKRDPNADYRLPPVAKSIKSLLEGSVAPDREAALAAHLGECSACRALLASVAAGDRPSQSWVETFRQPRTPLGPVMQEMLNSIGASRWETASPRKNLPENQVDGLIGAGKVEVANDFETGLKLRRRPGASLPFLEPPDGPDCIGRLGPYRVLKLLGRGGMGVVFQARDPVLDRLVAIKALTPQLCGNPTAHRALLRERACGGSHQSPQRRHDLCRRGGGGPALVGDGICPRRIATRADCKEGPAAAAGNRADRRPGGGRACRRTPARTRSPRYQACQYPFGQTIGTGENH